MIACVVFYNDINETLLMDLSTKVDTIIAVDGAYKDFPHVKPFSTDGSIETAKKYATVVETDKAWETQVDKRNAYLDLVPEGESFIVIDTDEKLLSRPKDGNWKVEIWSMTPGGVNYFMPRVHVKTPGLRYYKTHMTMKDDNGLINTEQFEKSDAVIEHYLDRDEQRLKDKEIYRKKHNERELKDRENLVNEMRGQGSQEHRYEWKDISSH